MMMTNRFIKIGAAAELLGVSIDTLRKWELSGELIPDRKSQAGTRFYDSSKLINLGDKDRLLRFGAELVFSFCEPQGIEIVIINRGEQPSFEEELAQVVLEIITVFSARLYGC